MPRVELFKIFRWLWIAAEVRDDGLWNDHRVGFTRGHAATRLVRMYRQL